jgi:hypothetical protein
MFVDTSHEMLAVLGVFAAIDINLKISQFNIPSSMYTSTLLVLL